jgi:hypothetical protein
MGSQFLELWVWHSRERNEKPDQRFALPFGGQVRIGQGPGVDVTVANRTIGQHHFELRRDDSGIWLTDVGSRGGTFLNEDTLLLRESTLLKPCDSMGTLEVLFRIVPDEMVPESWLRWNDGTVFHLARTISKDRKFEILPILHDALLDAGCDNENILTHLRQPGPHACGCWVIDLLLGQD